jgi:hypothetical protein
MRLGRFSFNQNSAYISGSYVGASNISNRRAKISRASACCSQDYLYCSGILERLAFLQSEIDNIQSSLAYYVPINGDTTINDVKTFTVVPRSSSLPTRNDDLVNKLYVDSFIAPRSINIQNLSVPANTTTLLNNSIQITGIDSADFFGTNAYIQIGYLFDQYTSNLVTKYSIGGELLLFPQRTTSSYATTSNSLVNNFTAGASFETYNITNSISFGATPTTNSGYESAGPTGLQRFYWSSAPAAGQASGYPVLPNTFYLQSSWSNVTGTSGTAKFGFCILSPSAVIGSGFSLQLTLINNPFPNAQITFGSN